MNDERQKHWDGVYKTKLPTEVSWYRPRLDTSLALIAEADPKATGSVIDIGGGESTLVDDLLARGYAEVAVADISATALAVTRERLGERAAKVQWHCGDVTQLPLPEARYDVWHDRAVFHFLTDAASRAAYVRQVVRSVRPGGHVIIGAFGPNGPTQCSGLDVVRYDANALHRELGPGFELLRQLEEEHTTPMGRSQHFVWCSCRLGASRDR